MTAQNKTTIKSYFQTGDRPTQAQFADLIDSYQDTNTNLTTLASANLGAVGLQVLSCVTSASAQSAIGGTTVGRAVFQATTTAAAQQALGGGTAGRQIFESITAASAASIISVSVTARVFSSAGTTIYSKPSGLKYAAVEVLGAGGAGGGAVSTTGAQSSTGAGGGGAGYAYRILTAASIAASETLTIGAAGTGSAGATGGNGGNSSFGILAIASGGLGGAASAVSTGGPSVATGGAAGGATGGDVNITGQTGSDGQAVFNAGVTISGQGGGSIKGLPGSPAYSVTTGNVGRSATGYGAGGAGALNQSSQAARAGGNGSGGVIIVYEYT